MVSNLGPDYKSAYDALKENVSPELRKKIEDKSVFYKDILAIARSVFIKEEVNGKFSIKKHVMDRNSEIPLEQQDLIRNIYLLGQQSTEVQVVKRGAKHKLEEDGSAEVKVKKQKKSSEEESVDVPIRRGKRKAVEQEEQPTKKHKTESSKPKIKEVEDIFAVESETPEAILSLIAKYVDETSDAIMGFFKDGNPIPQYLKESTKYFDFSQEQLNLEIFKYEISQLKNLKSIKLPINADDSYIEAIVKAFPSLEYLDLSDCENITNIGVDNAIQSFSKLKYLNLSNINITDEAFVNISRLATSLQTIIIREADVSGRFLSYFNESFDELRTFVLSGCDNLVESHFDHAILRFPVLEELEIIHIANDDSVIGHMVKGAKKVERLNIEDTLVGDRTLELIANECPHLKSINISGCSEISESGISSLFSGCLNLQELQLEESGADDQWCKMIGEKSRTLNKLILYISEDITDEGMKSISEGCKDLKSFSLSGSSVTDVGFFYLSQGVKNLEELELMQNNRLSSQTFEYILKWRDTLQSLRINECDGLCNNDAITSLSPGLPFLKSLDMAMGNVSAEKIMKNINDEGLRNFAEWFPSLEKLDLCWLYITCEGIEYLKELPRLTDLSLRGCPITDEDIELFLEFPELTRLDLRRCRYITSINEINRLRGNGIEVLTDLG